MRLPASSLALPLAAWLVTSSAAPGQPLAMAEAEGAAYIVQNGVLIRIDLGTMQVESRRTLWRGPGPWDNRLVLARSDDGLAFHDTGQVLVQGGGVPDLLTDREGRIIAIYQYFPDSPEEAFDKIAVSISSDRGQTWGDPQVISIGGVPADAARAPCDPDLVLLPDGRVRLYFTYDVHAGERGRPRTCSAVSSDCVHFELEPGDRFADPPDPVLDPSVIRCGGRWHLYAQLQARFGHNYHAVSEDGLSFMRMPDVETPGMHMLGNAIEVAGGYRFYGSGRGGIVSAFSEDGEGWRVEEGLRLSGTGDPGVLRLPDGSFLMLHTQRREPARG